MGIEIDEQLRQDIEAVRLEVDCPRNFACLDPDSDEGPRIRAFAGGMMTECLEKGRCPCGVRLYFGGAVFCKCPLWQKVAMLQQTR